MAPIDLDYTLTFTLEGEGVKKINELTKKQLEEAKRLIDKALEDYEKPKGIIKVEKSLIPTCVYIEYATEEESEKAVECLRAWERLRNRGFKFTGYNACSIDYDIDEQYRRYISEDLDILFGGEK